MCRVDAKDAFRQAPVDPAVAPAFGYVVGGRVVVDLRLQFTWGNSPGFWGLVSSALEHSHTHSTFQEAVVSFSRAIEQRPEQPLPYLGRIVAQGMLALEAAGLRKEDVDEPTEMYRLYQTIDAEAQEQVLSDLRKFEDAVLGVMESENLTEADLDIELEYFRVIAQYFATGEQPEYFEATNEDAAPTVDVLEMR